MKKILVIDDTPTKRNEVVKCLKGFFEGINKEISIIEITADNLYKYLPEKLNNVKSHAPEDILAATFEQENDIGLIVVDHDLSMLNGRLSEPVIATASHAASIPMCRYARIPNRQPITKLSDAIEVGSQFSIKIEAPDTIENAANVVEIFSGFQEIYNRISELADEELNRGPAHVLSKILGENSHKDYYLNYLESSGILTEIIELQAIKEEAEDTFHEIAKKRLSYIIGYWLYNSILRFPGPILNKTAAYSYLNIKQEDFETNKKYFLSAKYTGPFSLVNEFWWKNKLDDLIGDHWDGKDYLNTLGITVESCKCYYEAEKDAGFYCVLAKKPVSREASIGNVSWLPSGAIMCRIGKDVYEQYAPLLGHYNY